MRREVWCRGKEASMTEILDAREKRSQIQQELLAKGGETLVSFTLNIPGPVKIFPLAEWSFFVGESLIEHVLENRAFGKKREPGTYRIPGFLQSPGFPLCCEKSLVSGGGKSSFGPAF